MKKFYDVLKDSDEELETYENSDDSLDIDGMDVDLAKEFNVKGMFWRILPPTEEDKKYYYPFDIDGRTVYFWRKWSGKTLMKLQDLYTFALKNKRK